MRFLKNSFVGLFLAALTISLLAYAGSIVSTAVKERMERQSPNRVARERVYAVHVVRAAPTQTVPQILSFGEVRSLRTLEVRAPASGEIVELSPNFIEGGVFEKGEFILAVDPSDAQSQLDLALADKQDAEVQRNDALRALDIAREELVAAERQVELRRQSLERRNLLRDRGVGTDIAVEDAELSLSSALQSVLTRRKAVAQAETRVEQAESLVHRREISRREAQRKLQETRLTAEFAGSLSDVALVQGGLVNANERVALLVDPNFLEVSFRVSNEQYARFIDANGRLKPLAVAVSGSSLSARARIVRESATVGEGQTGRMIYALVDDGRQSGLRPGDFVEVTIKESPIDGVLLLPAEAVDGDGQILVVGDDERLSERDTTILRKQGDQVILSGTGLAGELVVTKRSPLIGNGIRVRPILPETASLLEEPQDIVLSDEERAELVAFVEGNSRMPEAAKQRLLEVLNQETVPQATLDRLRSRMGG